MDAILLRKAGSLERCIARVLDKYQGNEAAFDDDIDLQDIIVLNLQRACQTAIDMALRIGRLRRLAFPSDTADMFRVLVSAGLLPRDLAESLVRMVGFRNVAVHEYQELDLQKVRHIIEHRPRRSAGIQQGDVAGGPKWLSTVELVKATAACYFWWRADAQLGALSRS